MSLQWLIGALQNSLKECSIYSYSRVKIASWDGSNELQVLEYIARRAVRDRNTVSKAYIYKEGNLEFSSLEA